MALLFKTLFASLVVWALRPKHLKYIIIFGLIIAIAYFYTVYTENPDVH